MSFSPASSLPPDPVLRVRLTNVSYSLAKPEPGLDQQASCFSHGRPFADVPLIRVLGMTEGGQVRALALPFSRATFGRHLDPRGKKAGGRAGGREHGLPLRSAAAYLTLPCPR